MAISDIRKTALGIINEVERKLGVSPSVSLTSRNLTTTLLDYLNDVIEEVSDFGDWQQMYREVLVTASASLGTYEVAVSSQVKNIYEIAWGDDASSLEVRTIEDIRRLQRIQSFGTPRQFAVIGVSGVNPLFRIYPIPTSATFTAVNSPTFDIAYYKKPGILTTADSSSTPAFPSRLLVQGVYAKAVLEEAGGTPTPEYQTIYTEYIRMRRESLNRFNADTGTDIYMVPTGKFSGF